MGATIGLALAGALAGLVVRTDGAPAFLLIAPVWLLLYPASALIGYDMATWGGGADDGFPLRLGGYCVAVAAAHLTMAVAVAVLAFAEINDDPLWYVLYALCAGPAIPARAAALRIERRWHVPPGALMGASVVLVVLAWFVSFLIVAAASVSVDS